LDECEFIIARLESIKPTGQFEAIRPRAIYFDDKHCQFTVFADYLVPHGQEPSLRPSDFNATLEDGQALHTDGIGSWHDTHWDVALRRIFPYSDHFDLDHYDFYNPNRGMFEVGLPRDSYFLGEAAAYGDYWRES
jgi:hypothetical protein